MNVLPVGGGVVAGGGGVVAVGGGVGGDTPPINGN